MPDPTRHLAASILLEHVASGVEVTYPFPGNPIALLRVEGAVPRLTLRVESAQTPPTSLNALRHLAVGSIMADGQQFMTVTVTGEALLLDGHAMLCAIADRVQVEQRNARDAILETVAQWREVLAARARLSHEAEVGLFGELTVLSAMLISVGASAFGAWRATSDEEHDFGLENVDLEVKTTTNERRVHWISGIRQLMPSTDRPLKLLSIQITRGGNAGQTLAELVDSVRSAVDEPAAFDSRLADVGWVAAEADLYRERWTLRTAPALFAVHADFPRLTPQSLGSLPVEHGRLVEVHYRIDLEGRAADSAAVDGLDATLTQLKTGSPENAG